MNHSPKEVAEMMSTFLESHCKDSRPDVELQEFITKFHKQHRWLIDFVNRLSLTLKHFFYEVKFVVITLMSSHNSAVKQNYHFDTSRLYRSHPISLLNVGGLCCAR